LNKPLPLQKRWPAHLTAEQQLHLFTRIGRVFKNAIDARAPKQRPPGKAGLRAEKGYYRLLYLEDDYQQKVDRRKTATADESPYDWQHLTEVLRQLTDIPELQSEIIAGIESALDEIMAKL
jgi:hypothetical protein